MNAVSDRPSVSSLRWVAQTFGMLIAFVALLGIVEAITDLASYKSGRTIPGRRSGPNQSCMEARNRIYFMGFDRVPEWRNWQTRWTQNPVPGNRGVGSIPSSGMPYSLIFL